MIPLVRPYLPRLLLAGLLAALTELAGLGLMGTATYLLVRAAEQPPLSALTVAIVAVRALAIGRGVLRYTERLAGHDATLRLLTEVRTRVYASLVARGVNLRSGDLLSRLVSDVDAVQDVLLRCLVPAFAALIVAVAAIGGAFAVAPGAGLAVAAGLLVAGVGLPALAVVLARRTADQVAPLRGALAAGAVDLMHGAADLAAYGATGAALARAGQEATELARLERRLSVAAWAVDGAGVLVGGLTAAAVLAAGPGGVATTVLAVCALVAVESALALVVSARRWVEVRGSVRRVLPLVDVEVGLSTPISGDQNGVDRPTSTSGPVALVVDRVTVHGRALSMVDLSVPAGHRVAVVGPSGAGKSTLLAVLSGHLDPDEGRVAAAGRDLAAWRPPDVRRAISGLLAEAHVFHATVRENVALGRPDATDAEFDAAARAAGLSDWIAAQPDGWDTMVGEDGAQLSGGQRQRLALARAVLAAPAVLLLDEPTESLDPRAADRVLADVLTHAGAASVVVVTHRLTGLDVLDEIVVLDEGRVVARGSHATLAERPGWYRERWLAERSHLGV